MFQHFACSYFSCTCFSRDPKYFRVLRVIGARLLRCRASLSIARTTAHTDEQRSNSRVTQTGDLRGGTETQRTNHNEATCGCVFRVHDMNMRKGNIRGLWPQTLLESCMFLTLTLPRHRGLYTNHTNCHCLLHQPHLLHWHSGSSHWRVVPVVCRSCNTGDRARPRPSAQAPQEYFRKCWTQDAHVWSIRATHLSRVSAVSAPRRSKGFCALCWARRAWATVTSTTTPSTCQPFALEQVIATATAPLSSQTAPQPSTVTPDVDREPEQRAAPTSRLSTACWPLSLAHLSSRATENRWWRRFLPQ